MPTKIPLRKRRSDDRTDVWRMARPLKQKVDLAAIALIGLFVIAVFFVLYVGRTFFLPVVVALLLGKLLTPAVRLLRRFHVPNGLGAALVLLLLMGATSASLYYLSGPASEWMESAPENLTVAESKLRAVIRPMERVQEAAREVQEAAQGAVGGPAVAAEVTLKRPSLAETLLGQTRAFLVGLLLVFFLLYFLLAAGDQFLRTLVHELPHLRDQRKAVEITHSIETALTTYLTTATLINIGLGVVVALVFSWFGMPNPELWGVVAGFLNFIPYIGPVITTTITGLVALVSFDNVAQALAVPATYFAINALEGYLVTPWIMGKRLTLNPVFIFLTVMLWGWIWGIPGTLLAVPLLVAFKIFCDHIDGLKPIGAFLGSAK